MFITSSIIAAGFNNTIAGTDFWETPLGSILSTVMGITGILFVIYSIFKTFKNVATGKVGEAVKGIVWSVVFAAVLFNPPMIQTAIAAAGKFVQKGIDTVAEIGDSTGGTTQTPGSTPVTVPASTPVTAPATPTSVATPAGA